MKGMTRIVQGMLCVLLVMVGLVGCSGESSGNEVDYADDEAMQIIAKGWQRRSDLLDGASSEDEDYADELKSGIQAEIDNAESLKSRQFENSQMQEDVIAYLNSLDDQLEVLNSYSMNDVDYYTEWNKVYDERCQLLKTFVDDYGLTVDQKYQSTLDQMLANGVAAEKKAGQQEAIEALISGASWEKTEEYGYFTYTAVVENTSDYDFSNVSLVVSLYDADDVKTESYASANSWKKGDKVKFEVYGNQVDAQRVEALVEYFEANE